MENIYWGLVSAYEDLQAKQHAVDQSSQLLKDDQKQLQIGTLAPLDVVSARSGLETDNQALIASESNLEYQQLLMKQAIARSLDDPTLANAPVIPTDRVSLIETPEEHAAADDLVREAEANSPTIEQAILNLKNDEITLKGEKNGMLPTLDAYAFYGATGLGGMQSPYCVNFETAAEVPCVRARKLSSHYLRQRGFGSVQQQRSEQGRGLQPDHPDPQPHSTGGAGALGAGISPSADAAAAALRADADECDQRAVCAD